MYLKSLSLRGFKSFADPTTLEFEPGVAVIVGPNGSGKSNVVDAVAWVLGAQGPRVVRSSKMDDVIFAGTQKRAALGRAEVSLTIDNASGKLPIDLAEVTITRTLFRTGESEYSMNGVPCRLLDIQELLSDAGVGRQQHVIMGQGQLDAVLQARPEDRRAVIEDAAGILKFRRRRERAERRIEATEANMTRLQDMHREVRRQLRPLERQAEAARRHDSLASELRALKLYVAGMELKSLERRLAEAREARQASEGEESRLAAELSRLDQLLADLEAALWEEQSNDAATPLARAERLRERARGIGAVIAERRRSVSLALTALTETGLVASLEAEGARIESELSGAADGLAALQPERAELDLAEVELAAREQEWAGGEPSRAAVAAAEGVSSMRHARDAIGNELASAREALARDAEREAAVSRQLEDLATSAGEGVLVAGRAAEAAAAAHAALVDAETAERETAAAVMSAEAASRAAVERAQGLAARASALQLALDEVRARAGVERLTGQAGVLGTLLDVVEIDDGCELAFEAGVAEALGSVVVEGDAAARDALRHLQVSGLTGGVVRVGTAAPINPLGAADAVVDVSVDARVGGDRRLRSCVRAVHPGVAVLLDRLLDGVVLCSGDLRAALELIDKLGDDAVVVTREGDRFSSRGWRLGAGTAGATKAALEVVRLESIVAEQLATDARLVAEDARRSHVEARTAARDLGRTFEGAAAEERQAKAHCGEINRRLTLLREQAPSVSETSSERGRRVGTLAAELEDAGRALAAAEQSEREIAGVAGRAAAVRRELDDKVRSLASTRSDLKIRASVLLERRSVLLVRRGEIEARLAGYESARFEATARRERHEAAARALERLSTAVATVGSDLGAALSVLEERRARRDSAVAFVSGRLTTSRTLRASAERELAGVRERSQRIELELAELRVRLESAVAALRHDLETEPAHAMAAVCPELPPGMTAAARVRELERELRLLGPVNPLALEELAAVEERDSFLSSQIEDVKSTRRELARVIKAVDTEIVSVFAEAFADVARHFEELFETLFPGGAGRLTLLDPDDLLGTGIEIEARPAGRNVRRLSLLSGGERSLVALAFLFAVFRSRPSPFYLMDEVEAALDDINLHRFLDLVDEFRSEAQLLIVSHQKRTMESADVLYGVSLQPGGASKVVTERLGSERARTG